jgi:hypothetical protein
MPQSHDTIPLCCYAAVPLRCYADALLGGGAALRLCYGAEL